MKVVVVVFSALLVGCTAGSPDLQPVPGSLIYGGQPSTKLTRAPIGSPVPHRFTDRFGREWEETYLIQADRSLRLVNRQRIEYPDD